MIRYSTDQEDFIITLKMEAICSIETSVGFERATRRYMPENITVHNRCEKLNILSLVLFSLVLNPSVTCKHYASRESNQPNFF
jgi:hypothetical protein